MRTSVVHQVPSHANHTFLPVTRELQLTLGHLCAFVPNLRYNLTARHNLQFLSKSCPSGDSKTFFA